MPGLAPPTTVSPSPLSPSGVCDMQGQQPSVRKINQTLEHSSLPSVIDMIQSALRCHSPPPSPQKIVHQLCHASSGNHNTPFVLGWQYLQLSGVAMVLTVQRRQQSLDWHAPHCTQCSGSPTTTGVRKLSKLPLPVLATSKLQLQLPSAGSACPLLVVEYLSQ